MYLHIIYFDLGKVTHPLSKDTLQIDILNLLPGCDSKSALSRYMYANREHTELILIIYFDHNYVEVINHENT